MSHSAKGLKIDRVRALITQTKKFMIQLNYFFDDQQVKLADQPWDYRWVEQWIAIVDRENSQQVLQLLGEYEDELPSFLQDFYNRIKVLLGWFEPTEEIPLQTRAKRVVNKCKAHIERAIVRLEELRKIGSENAAEPIYYQQMARKIQSLINAANGILNGFAPEIPKVVPYAKKSWQHVSLLQAQLYVSLRAAGNALEHPELHNHAMERIRGIHERVTKPNFGHDIETTKTTNRYLGTQSRPMPHHTSEHHQYVPEDMPQRLVKFSRELRVVELNDMTNQRMQELLGSDQALPVPKIKHR